MLIFVVPLSSEFVQHCPADDDEINPSRDKEDAQFLNGPDFCNLVNGFIAERKFTFLQPDSNDLKNMRRAVKLVSLSVTSDCLH